MQNKIENGVATKMWDLSFIPKNKKGIGGFLYAEIEEE
jgi:hypothetical protein